MVNLKAYFVFLSNLKLSCALLTSLKLKQKQNDMKSVSTIKKSYGLGDGFSIFWFSLNVYDKHNAVTKFSTMLLKAKNAHELKYFLDPNGVQRCLVSKIFLAIT